MSEQNRKYDSGNPEQGGYSGRNQNDQNNSNNGSGNGQGGNNNSGMPPRKQSLMFLVIAVVLTFISMSLIMNVFSGDASTEITYDEFLQKLDAGEIAKVEIKSDTLNIIPKTDAAKDQSGNSAVQDLYTPAFNPFGTQAPQVTYYTGITESGDVLVERLTKAGVEIKTYIPDNSGWILSIILTYILPILLIWFLLSFAYRKMAGGGGPMGVGKSNAKVYVQKETGVTFDDVAGVDEAKESLVEVVDFLHDPSKYTKIGAKLPKGALLVGPPGTGKTLLAKAVAGEAHVPFFSLTGSDFIELYVGVGASRVRDLFREANKNAPCIIFIDEIDAIGRSRDSKYGGGNEEREQTLNQLLSEMDGFDPSKGVLVLGATNRPEILDKALLRPGRFDRRIVVERPDVKGREAILRVHAKDVKMDETVDFKEIALATAGSVGSDLANMINEAAINAVKDKREFVSQKDLMEAIEQVIAGKEKKDRIMSKEERKIVSYHEIGHALLTALQKNTEPVQKITIIPRTMGALGYVLQVPEEEKYLENDEELRQKLVIYMGGRAAESIVFGSVTSGAANDIEQATNLAKNMITRYGMSKKFGPMGLATIENQYLSGNARLECSDMTAAQIDEEVKSMLNESLETAIKLLKENREVMDKLAEFLIEKETITGKEFMKIYRELKGIPEPEEESTENKEDTENSEKVDDVEDKDAVSGEESSSQDTEEMYGI
ncbi:MAG: ATP-dependent zinc metalloprotease FtsH [Lachnospiraceae bacterium]|nr:ATP-dependent zinc metalloprotease FtsH [Lachnospiraceae bacterium]